MAKAKQKDVLTNECLMKNFPDTFTLALSSIDYARNRIYSGKEFVLGQLNEVTYKNADLPKLGSDSIGVGFHKSSDR